MIKQFAQRNILNRPRKSKYVSRLDIGPGSDKIDKFLDIDAYMVFILDSSSKQGRRGWTEPDKFINSRHLFRPTEDFLPLFVSYNFRVSISYKYDENRFPQAI